MPGLSALLSDTELTEYVVELIFVSDFAGDFTEVLQGSADVEGE
jgi:hypothetical protein